MKYLSNPLLQLFVGVFALLQSNVYAGVNHIDSVNESEELTVELHGNFDKDNRVVDIDIILIERVEIEEGLLCKEAEKVFANVFNRGVTGNVSVSAINVNGKSVFCGEFTG